MISLSVWIPNFSFKGWLFKNDNWEMYVIRKYTDIYQLYFGSTHFPGLANKPCLRDEDVFWSSEVAAVHGLRHVQEETDGNRSWSVQAVYIPRKLWQSYCGIWLIQCDSMHQRLCTYGMNWRQSEDCRTEDCKVRTSQNLMCISLSSWPFKLKRKSFCPTKRASICSLWCFSEV